MERLQLDYLQSIFIYHAIVFMVVFCPLNMLTGVVGFTAEAAPTHRGFRVDLVAGFSLNCCCRSGERSEQTWLRCSSNF